MMQPEPSDSEKLASALKRIALLEAQALEAQQFILKLARERNKRKAEEARWQHQQAVTMMEW